eukprot:scaffold44779_cov38-Attheya_sp.AAC.1
MPGINSAPPDGGGLLDEFDDEYVWTSPPLTATNPLHLGLRELEASLRCPICQDLFQIPVSFAKTCSHSFCSECIRTCLANGMKSLKRTAQCPVCRDEVGPDWERAISSNRGLEECVRKYQAIRPLLLQTLVSQTTPTNQQPPIAIQKKSDQDHAMTRSASEDNENDANENLQTMEPDGKRRRTSSRIKQGGVDSKDSASDTDKLLLSRERAPPRMVVAAVAAPKREKRRMPHFHGMRRKKLVELCHADGLSPSGTDVDLRARYTEFITLYNAECDSEFPRPVHQVASELHRRERARQDEKRQSILSGANSHTVHLDRLKQARKAVGEGSVEVAMSSGNAIFDAQMKGNFQRLVEEARKRGMAGKHKAMNKPAAGTGAGTDEPATRVTNQDGDTTTNESIQSNTPNSEMGLPLVSQSSPAPAATMQTKSNATSTNQLLPSVRSIRSPSNLASPLIAMGKKASVTAPSQNSGTKSPALMAQSSFSSSTPGAPSSKTQSWNAAASGE